MAMIVNVKEYLEGLQQAELSKPPSKRKPIPTPRVMAEAGGVPRQSVYSFLRRESYTTINLNILNGIMTSCRNYGHNTQLTDLLVYTEEPEN